MQISCETDDCVPAVRNEFDAELFSDPTYPSRLAEPSALGCVRLNDVEGARAEMLKVLGDFPSEMKRSLEGR